MKDDSREGEGRGLSRRDFVKGTSRAAAGVALGVSAFGQKSHVDPQRIPRVVRAYDQNASTWDWSSNYYFDFIDQAAVNQMMWQGLMSLTGASTPRLACERVIPTYQPGDKIAIKINLNNNSNQSNEIDATAPVLNAVLLVLISGLGVPEGDIYVYDVSRAIPTFRIRSRVPYAVNFVQSGDPLAQSDSNAPISFRGISTQYCPLVLTQAGLDLLDHFRTMGSAAEQISMTASGKSESIEGQVSITASDVLSAHFLPEFLKVLRDRAPGISVEIVASDDIRDLKRREADIAIRHVRPEQPDLIAKLLVESAARFYAASDYLERYGRPASVADLAGALFVGYGDPARLLPHLAHLNLPLTKANFRYVSESGVTGWEMVRQGLGIGIMSTALGERTPGVEPVLPDLIPKITFPTWLVAHRELHTNRRIRLVFDLLSDHLKM